MDIHTDTSDFSVCPVAAMPTPAQPVAELRAILGQSRFHHIGYIVPDMEKSIARFKHFFPIVSVNSAHHPEQMVTVTMLQTWQGELKAELVTPDPSNVLLRKQTESANGVVHPYHICFWVPDFQQTYKTLRSVGWLPLTRPFQTHHQNWQASHLFHADAGMIEIMG